MADKCIFVPASNTFTLIGSKGPSHTIDTVIAKVLGYYNLERLIFTLASAVDNTAPKNVDDVTSFVVRFTNNTITFPRIGSSSAVCQPDAKKGTALLFYLRAIIYLTCNCCVSGGWFATATHVPTQLRRDKANTLNSGLGTCSLQRALNLRPLIKRHTHPQF